MCRWSIAERQEAVKELTNGGLATREIGEVLGVSHVTVSKDVKKLTPVDVVATLAFRLTGVPANRVPDRNSIPKRKGFVIAHDLHFCRWRLFRHFPATFSPLPHATNPIWENVFPNFRSDC
jgi:hypothetical protein